MRARYALVLLVFAAMPVLADDLYSVYFSPQPSVAPQKVNVSGGKAERRWAIVYNLTNRPVTPGAHSYKLLLRVSPPSGPLVCETSTIVQPWEGKYTIKKIAYFEAIYKNPRLPGGKVVPSSTGPAPGKYSLHAYLIEQIPPGESPQDTDPSNNQYPFATGNPIQVTLEVRPGADEIKCGHAISRKEPLGDLRPVVRP